MPLTPHTTILDGKYTIIRELGKGAFAYVWLAEDHRVGQQVAIKEMRRGELSRDEFTDLASRFQREAKIGRALRHPNVVEVYTVEQWDDDLLLVMEYVEGETLQERLVRAGPLELETAVTVAVQLCDALDAVHEHPLGIVHRDIKPSNVLLTERGVPKLTDFGVAQLAGETGRTFGSGRHHPGTPLYMAPEQESGFGYLAPAADIYALALTVGEMLTGRPVKPRLLRGDSWADVLREEPQWLAEALEKATAREWQERYRQAGEVKAALQTGLRSEVEAREQARREAEERARQEKLASLYNAAQAAVKAKQWQETIRHCDEIAAMGVDHRDMRQLRAQAEAGLRVVREAEEKREKNQAELARLIERLEPDYRDVAQVKAHTEGKPRERREAEAVAQRQEVEEHARQQTEVAAHRRAAVAAERNSTRKITWWFALILTVVGLIGYLVTIPFLTGFSFWVLLLAAALLLVVMGRISLWKTAWWLALILTVIGVIGYVVTIPVITAWSFWIVLVATALMLVVTGSEST